MLNDAWKYRLKVLCLLAGLTALVLVIYWPVQHFAFINYDDQHYVTENYKIQAPISFQSLCLILTDIHTGNWHPLTMLSHQLDWQWYGPDAGGHHRTNVLLHILNTLLLFLLFHAMTGSRWRSACVAALFAVHPIHMESVAWVAERKNVLSTFFWLLTMLCYAWYVRLPDWKRYTVMMVCFVSGLMSKSMLVTLPVVLLLMDFWPLRRVILPDNRSSSLVRVIWENLFYLIREKIPLFVASVVFMGIAIYTQKIGNVFHNPESLSLPDRVANAVVSYVVYLKKLFYPVDLAIFYPLYPIVPWRAVLALLFLLLATFVACRYSKKYPYLIVGWLWYLVTLMPVIGFIQIGRQSMADRYAYIPFIGLFVALAWTVPRAFSKWRHSEIYAPALLAGFILILTVSSYLRIGIWQNTATLFEDALKTNPRNSLAYNVLGLEKANQGKLDEALPYFYVSLKMNPKNENAYNNAGNVYFMQGRYPEAYQCYRKALSINDRSAISYHNLGVWFAVHNRFDDALLHFTKALEIAPEDINARMGMGQTLLRMGKPDEAKAHFEKVIRLNPQNMQAKKALTGSSKT
jgi:Tfp pilus assembly protein PilF